MWLADTPPWLWCLFPSPAHVCDCLRSTFLKKCLTIPELHKNFKGVLRQQINKASKQKSLKSVAAHKCSPGNQVSVLLLTGNVVGVCKMYKLLCFLHLINVWVKGTSIKVFLTKSNLKSCENVIIMMWKFRKELFWLCSIFSVVLTFFGTELQ